MLLLLKQTRDFRELKVQSLKVYDRVSEASVKDSRGA